MALLSHYTSERGLIGIVRTQSLWAGDYLNQNDKTEFIFAWRQVIDAACAELVSTYPPGTFKENVLETVQSGLNDHLIEQLKQASFQNNGYGSLYTVSFARAINSDEEDRGILTLWDRYTHNHRYTHNRGYCVQFTEESIRRVVKHEREYHSYSLVEICDVVYGLDKDDPQFKYLVQQSVFRMKEIIYCKTADDRFQFDRSKKAIDSVWIRDAILFCARHKDAAFRDEREVRIIAFPESRAQSRFLTGVATTKKINRYNDQADARRYICIGDSVIPGLVPKRIIIGPHADAQVNFIEALYPKCPMYSRSTIPLRK